MFNKKQVLLACAWIVTVSVFLMAMEHDRNKQAGRPHMTVKSDLPKPSDSPVAAAATHDDKPAQTIAINAGVVVRTLTTPSKPVGLNVSFLLDSDQHYHRAISTEQQFKDMQVGSLRFPYGAQANNYLWDADGTYGGNLTPKVVDMKVAPGNFTWAVNSDGTFKNAMDFDEFMAICQRNGIEPVVVVNAMGHLYKGPNAPTFDQLVASAAAWVKYTKDKGYHVKYWEIGNEQDHLYQVDKSTSLPLQDPGGVDDGNPANDFVSVFKQIASAMKKVDPTIKTGPGLTGVTSWVNKLIEKDPQDVNFLIVHQYMYAFKNGGYTAWRDNTKDVVPSVTSVEKIAEKNGLDVLVTETNSYGGWPDGSGANDTYRALALFEMQMEEITKPNVVYTHIWNTRSPWHGEAGDGGLANVLKNDASGAREPIGDVVKIINENLLDTFVKTTVQSGTVRTYASEDKSNKQLTVFLMNKAETPVDVNVDLAHFGNGAHPLHGERYVFKGTSCTDLHPTYTKSGSVSENDHSFTTTLEGCSLTVVKMSQK